MTGFASMAERHAFGLEALAEMTGKLLQAAYLRASRPGDTGDQDRATLLFDRLARGFRLTIALEARLDRDRRREAAGISDETAPHARTPGLPPPVAAPRPLRPSREADFEQDVDLEPSDLPGHIADLRRMVTEDADILDPDGAHAQTLDRWTGAWGDVVRASPDKGVDAPPQQPPASVQSPRAEPPRRASG